MNRNPRVLLVTPEITYLPKGMGNMAHAMTAKAGGLADVSASLVAALFDRGVDVHVALPHYRRLFHVDVGRFVSEELRVYLSKLPETRIHLAEDRVFYYREHVYGDDYSENRGIALAFQREVINNIIPTVKPDLIHCNDWMTGLIPAMARRMKIPCLFTVHNIFTVEMKLAEIEDRGIDAAEFWQYLYYKWPPGRYESCRNTIPVDLQTSGIFAAHFINTVSPSFLDEVAEGWHDAFVPPQIRNEMRNKRDHGCAAGILNAPDPGFDPRIDAMLAANYGPENHPEGKRANKAELQKRLGLDAEPEAPIFFWPSRLDPAQKGCQLLADILYRLVSTYWDDNLQVAVVANGSYQKVFREIVRFHGIYGRVAVCDFHEDVSRLGYAASDFMLMPSLFEPCGLPQMTSAIYGSLPIVRDTGGLHDTVRQLRVSEDDGNGFVFETYDARGLWWAIGEAMRFYRLPADAKARQIGRIMTESVRTFNHQVTASKYVELYERMLNRPLINEM